MNLSEILRETPALNELLPEIDMLCTLTHNRIVIIQQTRAVQRELDRRAKHRERYAITNSSTEDDGIVCRADDDPEGGS